jgi:hypothetical protein
MSVEKLIRQSIIEDNTLWWSQRRNRHKASIVRSHSAGGLKIFASLPPKSPRIWRPLACLARLDGTVTPGDRLLWATSRQLRHLYPIHFSLGNPSAWSDKLAWVKRHLGEVAYKWLILSHHKHLNYGHFLIDDRTKNGADRFQGEHILFGSPQFPDWPAVVDYLNGKNL